MKAFTIQGYTLQELKEKFPKAYDKALSFLREYYYDSATLDYKLEYWKDELVNYGFENANIQYSGFYCQGDGASFTANCNLPVVIDALQKDGEDFTALRKAASMEDITACVYRFSFHYYHDKTIKAKVNIEGDGIPVELEQLVNRLELAITELARSLSRKIYDDLENEYEHLTSDEYLEEFAEINDFYFTELGTIV